MSGELKNWLEQMPGRENLPFFTPPPRLYTIKDLYDGYKVDSPQSLDTVFDTRVYKWTRDGAGKIRMLNHEETVAARIHDTVMDKHVADFVDPTKRITIGFMGGHSITRTAVAFTRVARMARELRRRGFMIVTGGGPGLMEAANFGAFMAPYDDDKFLQAVNLLRQAPTYGGVCTNSKEGCSSFEKAEWLEAALRVRELVLGDWERPEEDGSSNLGIPTWFYGAEPPNMFATVAGKYFFNSLREDGLVSIANGGLIFGKGEAGTVQEIFQNSSYNYYRDGEMSATPMVFYDIDFWDPNLSMHIARRYFRWCNNSRCKLPINLTRV
jgi:predicted Rossmann-fold nucleotide-binding protein